MKDYNQIRDEYQQWKLANPDKNLDLPAYAQYADLAEGNNDRVSAYSDGYLKQANAAIDRVFTPIGSAAANTDLVKGIDSGLGTGNTVQSVVKGTPRAVAEGLSYFTGVGEAGLAARAGMMGAGLGSSFLRGADSAHPIVSGIINAATLPLGGKAAELGEQAAAGLVTKGLSKAATTAAETSTEFDPTQFVSPLKEKLASFIGGNTGVLGVNEVARQADSLVNGEGFQNPLSKENIISNVAGLAPFLPKTIHDFIAHPTAPVVAEARAKSLETYNNAVAERDQQAQTFDRTAEAMPPTADADTTLKNLAQVQEKRILSDFLGEKNKSAALAEEPTIANGVAETLFGNGIPKELPKAFDKMVKPAEEPTKTLLQPGVDFSSTEPGNLPKEFDPTKSHELAQANAEGLTDPVVLSKFTQDVNEQLKSWWDQQNQKTIVTNKSGGDFFADENRPGREEQAPTMLNPRVLETLQSEGRVPQLDSKWFADKFNENLQRNPTADPQEAWRHTVQQAANVMLELGETANRQKALEIQQRNSLQATTKLSEAERDIVHEANVRQLPQDLQDWLHTQEPQDRAVTQTKGARQQWAWGMRREVVDQAVKNYDPNTGLTRISINSGTKGNAVDKVLPLAEAVKIPLKQRALPTELQGSQKEVSLEARQERGKQSATAALSNEATDLDELRQRFQVGEDETGQLRLEPADVETPDIPAQSSSATEQNQGESLNRVREVYESIQDPKQSTKTWANFRDAFVGGDGRVLKEMQKRAMFPSAVEARLGGKSSDAAIEFAKKFYNKDKVTPQEVGDAVKSYWGKDSWERATQIIGKLSGLSSDDVQKATIAGWGREAGTVHAQGEPQSMRQTLPELMQTHFRMLGYGPEMVQHFVDMSTRINDMFGGLADAVKGAELGIYDPMSKETVVNKVTEQLVALGLHGNYYIDSAGQRRANPLIAIAVGHATKDKSLQPVMNWATSTVAVHEFVHDIQNNAVKNLQSPDPDVRRRAQAYLQLYDMADALSPTDRYAMLKNVFDVVVPPNFSRDVFKNMRPEIGGYLSYSSQKPTEFVATYAQLFASGQISGGSKLASLREALAWETPEVQNFLRGVYRDVSDFTDGLSRMAQNPVGTAETLGTKVVASNSAKIADAYYLVQKHMAELAKPDARVIAAQRSLADSTSLMAAGAADRLYGRPPVVATLTPSPDAELMANNNIKPDESLPRAQEAINTAQRYVFGTDDPTVNHLNFWQRNFAMFSQAAAAVGKQIAKDAANVLLSKQTRSRRLVDGILEPFMTRDKNQNLVLDPDGPAMQLRGDKNPNARGALNDVVRVLQEMGDRKELKVENVDMEQPFSSLMQQNGKLAEAVSERLSKVRPTDRTLIIGTADRMLKTYNNSGQVLLKSLQESTGVKIARALMAVDPTAKYDEAYQRGQGLINGLMTNDRIAVAQSLAGLDPAKAQSFVEMGTMLRGPLVGLEQMIKQRPFFASEQRPGRFIVETTNKEGNREIDGAQSIEHGKKIAAELQKQGSTPVEIYDKYARYGEFAGDLPAQYAEQYSQLETAAFQQSLTKIEQQFGKPVADTLRNEFSPTQKIQQAVAGATVQKYTMQRKLAGGRERLDYLQTMDNYVRGMAENAANRKTRDMVGLIQNDPSMKGIPEFSQLLETKLQDLMTPSPDWLNKVRTVGSSYFLAGNLANAIVEPAQTLVGVVPHLIRKGDTVMGAYGRVTKALSRLTDFTLNPAKLGTLANAGLRGDDSYEAQQAFYYRKYRDENPNMSPYDDLTVAGDRNALARARFGVGSDANLPISRLVGNGLYQISSKFMGLYTMAAHMNAKASFLAGFEQASQQGLKGEQAYDYARSVVANTQFSGGKANQPGIIAQANKSPIFRPVIGVASILQSYGLGMTTMMGTLGSEAIGHTPGLSGIERRQAQKAFGVMLTTQTALAGALGLPFAAAGLATLEKVFGVQANAAVRQGLAKLGGDDQELGATISDTMLNGLANQLLGLDVAGKTGLSSVLGTSPYSGFNFADLAGPAPSIVENMVRTLQDAGRGEFASAVQDLAPQGLKNLVGEMDTANKFGSVKFMDKQQNLIMDPTRLQSVLYAIGFKPKEMRQYQQASQLLQTSDKLASQMRERDTDRLAEGLLAGQTQPVHDYIAQLRADNPSIDPQSVLDSILGKATDMSFQQDLLSKPGRMTSQNAQTIASTFPSGVVNRQSEMAKLQMKQQLLAQVGMPYGTKPAGPQEYLRAALMDELVQTQGLTKSMAGRQVDLMLGARPYVN